MNHTLNIKRSKSHISTIRSMQVERILMLLIPITTYPLSFYHRIFMLSQCHHLAIQPSSTQFLWHTCIYTDLYSFPYKPTRDLNSIFRQSSRQILYQGHLLVVMEMIFGYHGKIFSSRRVVCSN